MKYLLICLLFFGSCSYVEQEIRTDDHRNICPSGTCFVTYAWYKSEIARAWYDDINTVTDSLVQLRKRQADSLVKALKKMK